MPVTWVGSFGTSVRTLGTRVLPLVQVLCLGTIVLYLLVTSALSLVTYVCSLLPEVVPGNLGLITGYRVWGPGYLGLVPRSLGLVPGSLG